MRRSTAGLGAVAAVATLISIVAVCASVADARDDGLGRLPPMGWNTWCTTASCHQPGTWNTSRHDVCTEWLVKDVAQAMIDQGMLSAGWNRINLDDCWGAVERNPDGTYAADPDRFPSGMKALADWLHEKGFLFGLYMSAGYTTCSTGNRPVPSIPGSYGHYEEDAATVASYGTDYVKLDWCGANNLSQPVVTPQFTAALNKTGRPIWSNFHCAHDPGNVPQWCMDAGNSYRIGHDHHDIWDNTAQEIEVLKLLAPFGRPSHWNDPDFLMTGGAGCDVNETAKRCPGQTETEYVTEMTLWTISASSLLVSTDVRNMTAFMKSVLLNKEAIAIHQDPAGIAGGLVDEWHCSGPAGTCQVWARPLTPKGRDPKDAVGGGYYAVALYNADESHHNITASFDKIPGADWGGDTKVSVRDVWKHADIGSATGSFTAGVEPHGTVYVTLTQQ